MDNKLKDKKILVGLTGGIAVYKVCSIVNSLIKKGAEVRVVMTENATRFVAPLTFQALTNHFVYVDMWSAYDHTKVEHITLAQWPDLILIAPASANTISKIVYGLADNLLTTVILASFQDTPIVISPAMNTQMWDNPITKINIKRLKELKRFIIIEPQKGKLACGDEGVGKIAETNLIVEKIENVLE